MVISGVVQHDQHARAAQRCRNNFLGNASKVTALNFWHIERTNFPVCGRTAPKQATDLRVGAWMSTGSLISWGTHMRVRVPCCWKWHSSKLHSSTSVRLASRRSFFKRRNGHGIPLCNLRPGLAQPESHLGEDPLALTLPEGHAVVLSQVLGQQRTVLEVLCTTTAMRIAAQVT